MIKIVEVGPRDGLQNEPTPISTNDKLKFIQLLAESGLADIEVTSFVHPRWVPQLADSGQLFGLLEPRPNLVYSCLVPNRKGLERALEVGATRIAVFTAASETFSQQNTNRSIADSLIELEQVTGHARSAGLSVRGYVSTAFVCPYEGEIEASRVRQVSQALLDMGVDEVSIGDTIGAAVPRDIDKTVGHLLESIPAAKLALHLHDTYGTALANVQAGLRLGIGCFDSSAGGLGGCPYAPGAAGNLATEDLLYFLTRSGYEHGVDLEKIVQASRFIAGVLGKDLPSRQFQRLARA
ncbi:MAG: hydroxymethylglutaryl-CoA lyase [Candidatus Eremiobacteraeota bacterium]|nr:hydroxymethylglutaryl-CoA lyase [Candidatus Eremiobacteraeota bacterium]